MARIHMPADGTGPLDKRLLNTLVYPIDRLGGPSGFFFRKTYTIANGAGTRQFNMCLLPSEDFIIDFAALRLTSNWVNDSGSNKGITMAIQAMESGVTARTVVDMVLDNGDFTGASYVYNSGTVEALASTHKAANRGPLFGEGPTTPQHDEYISGTTGFMCFGAIFQSRLLRLQIQPSDASANTNGNVEAIVGGRMLG